MTDEYTTSTGPLVNGGSYKETITRDSCPTSQSREEITLDILQFLAVEHGLRPLGVAREYAAESCDLVAQVNPGSESGLYWIYNDGNPEQEYCMF